MIDLCVVNFNTGDKLMRLLDTIHSDWDGDESTWSMYIADNGSTDESLAMLTQRSWYRGSLYSNENIGYSAACNQLASIGYGDIIGLLNADVWLTSADVQKIQEIFDKDPTVAILGPKQRDENGLIRHAGIVGDNEHPKHRGWNEFDPRDELYRDQVDCVTISGSAYFIRRDVWEELWNCEVYRAMFPDATGAFLPTPHFYEETWCSYHARYHNHRVVYDGSVSIGHTWHASSPIGSQNERFKVSYKIFSQAADFHGISHD